MKGGQKINIPQNKQDAKHNIKQIKETTKGPPTGQWHTYIYIYI